MHLQSKARYNVTTIFLAFAFVCFVFPIKSGKAATKLDINEIKAAFIYNFLKFVEWPKNDQKADEIVFCRHGENNLSKALGLLDGKFANNRKIVVKDTNDIDKCNDCLAIYITNASPEKFNIIRQKLGTRPVLTISDSKDFIQNGGMIGLIIIKGKLRFEINLKAAQKAKLKISSHLLKLATEVIQ